MNFQTVSTAQKLPTSNTEGNTTGTATGGYLADGFTPGPVLANALDFVDHSLARMIAELEKDHLLDTTDIIVSAKHGQSPMNPAALNRIDDSAIIGALNAAWAKTHEGNPLVAFSVNDDGMLVWFDNQWRNDPAAAPFARNFLLDYNVPGGSVNGKNITAAGLSQIYAGSNAARLFNVAPDDPRVPDLVGISQYGVVYTGKKGKIAEHGGDHLEDRNVPIVITGPGIAPNGFITTPVETDPDCANHPSTARHPTHRAPGRGHQPHRLTASNPIRQTTTTAEAGQRLRLSDACSVASRDRSPAAIDSLYERRVPLPADRSGWLR